MIRIPNIRLSLDAQESDLPRIAARALGVGEERILTCQITRKAVDARDKRDVHFVVTLNIAVNGDEAASLRACTHPQATLLTEKGAVRPPVFSSPHKNLSDNNPNQQAGGMPCSQIGALPRPLVVGAGPAGLFAAWALAQAGCMPLLIDRGKPVEERARDVEALWQSGTLNPESNPLFGEGGAGTFSDGKLTTGIKDPRGRTVLEILHACGAPPEILILAKPHIGTDKLRGVVAAMRGRILEMGGEIAYGTRLDALHTQDGRLISVTLRQGETVWKQETAQAVLAIGHSARDTFTMLHAAGVHMAAKPFAIGVRIEHAQKMIDRAQYGAFAAHPALHAAEYKLAVHLPGGRDVYTFCMCPGGSVVAAVSEAGALAVNGMSYHARSGENANSAVLVGVTEKDFESGHPLAGMWFQQKWEQMAFKAGGGGYRAPAQRVGDFLLGKRSVSHGDIVPSYRPGVTYGNLRECLPASITDALAQGIRLMDGKLRGFAMPGAVLTGVETRSSSPVRIPRDETGQSSLKGLFPAGEGAGYAGGILSAAVDGLRAAEAVLASLPQS